MMQQSTEVHIHGKIFFASVRSFSFRNPAFLFLFLFQLTLLQDSSAQSIQDTIYYDNYWRICEKPVARYYRTGEVVLSPQWHFANDVKDFYNEGQLEMEGRYSPAGKKNGTFTFYHPNGKMKTQGAFVNDTMKGIWSYYDAKGELYFQVDCENSHSYVPLFIKNPGGDTLLRAGTGRFAFKLLDYPEVFQKEMDYLVKGQCSQGKRTGEWEYDYFFNNNWRLYAKDVYEGGRFQSGKRFFFGEKDMSEAVMIGGLGINKLEHTEAFVHDLVFGEYDPGAHTQQLMPFFVHGEAPQFTSRSKNFEANVLDYIPLCGAAVGYGRWDTLKLFWQRGDIAPYKSNQNSWLIGYCLQSDNDKIRQQSDLFPVENLKDYAAHINFTVYENGHTSDVSVKGNFGKDILLHLGYYLSRLANLAPRREAGKAAASKQYLYLFTKVDKVVYRKHNYLVYRLLLSMKPPDQTEDKFDIADFVNASSVDENP